MIAFFNEKTFFLHTPKNKYYIKAIVLLVFKFDTGIE